MPRKGQRLSDEAKAKCRAASKALWESDAYRQKVTDAQIGHPVSAQVRAKISAARTGKPLSDAHKATLSAAAKALWQDAAYRETISERLHDPEVQARAFTPERNARVSAAKRQYWANLSPEERQRRTQLACRAMFAHVKPTVAEEAVAAALDTLGIDYVMQQEFTPYFADFYLPAFRCIVECDGASHGKPFRADDTRRDEWFTERGYRVVRLTNRIAKKNAVAALQAALTTPP